jgi:hypothetical protein
MCYGVEPSVLLKDVELFSDNLIIQNPKTRQQQRVFVIAFPYSLKLLLSTTNKFISLVHI